MKKVLYLLLFALLIQYCKEETCNTFAFDFDLIGSSTNKANQPSSVKDCDKLDKLEGVDYCCYHKMKADKDEVKFCSPLDKESYKKIKDYINGLEVIYDDVKVDCNSKFIMISLLSFALLLL